ncbi:hypothetical protein JCM19233_6797 [Vibrio astriarenae]|nr:hypothetical protein JCM19233_6797 [Vibrio sp. C7]
MASAVLTMSASIGAHLLRQAQQKAAFSTLVQSVLTSTQYAIATEWHDSGCRVLTEPPTLSTLVSTYHAPAEILTSPFEVSVDYRTEGTASWGLVLTIKVPDSLNGFMLKNTAQALVDEVRVTKETLTLYQGIHTAGSSSQHRYFVGERGCMQEEYQ